MLKTRTREVLYEKFRTEKLLARRATRNINEEQTRQLLKGTSLRKHVFWVLGVCVALTVIRDRPWIVIIYHLITYLNIIRLSFTIVCLSRGWKILYSPLPVY